MSKKISLSKGIVCVLSFLTVGLLAAAGLFAVETRGLRITAKDAASGQQKEGEMGSGLFFNRKH